MSKLRVGRSIGHGGAQGDRAARDGPQTLSSTGPVTGHVLAPLVTGMEVKPIRDTRRFFHRYTERAFLVAIAVLGALVIGGSANAAPSTNALGGPIPSNSSAPSAYPTVTTTTLTASPVSPVAQGTTVTLTAKVIPQTAAGTVQFKDGTTGLGNPVPVVNGTAMGAGSQLPVGARQLSAVFAPANPAAFSPSTSPALTYVVTGASRGPTATKTALATSPSSTVTQGTVIATITPSTAVGTVQFKDGTTDIGAPVTVSNNGTASGPTSLLAPGSHSVTAVFTPTDPAAFSPSTSPALTYVITKSTGPPATGSAPIGRAPIGPLPTGPAPVGPVPAPPWGPSP